MESCVEHCWGLNDVNEVARVRKIMPCKKIQHTMSLLIPWLNPESEVGC
jgi:hypothetical protein